MREGNKPQLLNASSVSSNAQARLDRRLKHYPSTLSTSKNSVVPKTSSTVRPTVTSVTTRLAKREMNKSTPSTSTKLTTKSYKGASPTAIATSNTGYERKSAMANPIEKKPGLKLSNIKVSSERISERSTITSPLIEKRSIDKGSSSKRSSESLSLIEKLDKISTKSTSLERLSLNTKLSTSPIVSKRLSGKIETSISVKRESLKSLENISKTSSVSNTIAGSIEYMMNNKRKRHLIRQSLPKSLHAKHNVGLTNIGNTCFMNSALQCLLNTEPLVEFFYHGMYTKDTNNSSPTKGNLSFADFIQTVWSSHGQVNPSGLKRNFDRYAPTYFYGTNQQDAQEFLRFLLDGLHEDLNRVKMKPRLLFDEKQEDQMTALQKANLSWNRYHALNDSTIFDIFGGQLQSKIICHTCHYESDTFETFWDLAVPIPKLHHIKERRSLSNIANIKICSINDCIQTFAEEEVLEEKYKCPKCKSPQKASKQLRIYKYPEVLVLQVKRFMHTRFGKEKLTTEVTYPDILEDFQSITSSTEGHDEPGSYELIGIICHSGNLTGGHYVAHCKSIEDGQWYLFNDSHVSPSKSQGHGYGAYLLFYSKLHSL